MYIFLYKSLYAFDRLINIELPKNTDMHDMHLTPECKMCKNVSCMVNSTWMCSSSPDARFEVEVKRPKEAKRVRRRSPSVLRRCRRLGTGPIWDPHVATWPGRKQPRQCAWRHEEDLCLTGGHLADDSMTRTLWIEGNHMEELVQNWQSWICKWNELNSSMRFGCFYYCYKML